MLNKHLLQRTYHRGMMPESHEAYRLCEPYEKTTQLITLKKFSL